MFKTRSENGRNNICGTKVAELRKALRISQRELSDKLCDVGLIVDKNAIQRIESGQRFVTDIELIQIAKIFSTTVEDLLNIN